MKIKVPYSFTKKDVKDNEELFKVSKKPKIKKFRNKKEEPSNGGSSKL